MRSVTKKLQQLAGQENVHELYGKMTAAREALMVEVLAKIQRGEVEAEKAERFGALLEEHGLPDQAKAIRSAFEEWGKK